MKEESWHYKRTCKFCGHIWWGLHCPHDGYQNPCPNCDKEPIPEPYDPKTHNCEFDEYEK